jgi:DNA-binding CsgD family transcriptional regulator
MLEDAIQAFKGSFDFDSSLIGVGHIDEETGFVVIENIVHRDNIDEDALKNLVKSYPAEHDVVGQVFAAFPRAVQVVSRSEYRALHADLESGGTAGVRAGKAMDDYLKVLGFQHVMLAGLESSYGLAWATFYRKNKDNAFSTTDAERARYLVPWKLYEWQRQTQQKRSDKLPTRLLPFTVHELQIILLVLRGFSAREISDRFGPTQGSIQQIVKNLRSRLKIRGRRKLTVADVEMYNGRD